MGCEHTTRDGGGSSVKPPQRSTGLYRDGVDVTVHQYHTRPV